MIVIKNAFLLLRGEDEGRILFSGYLLNENWQLSMISSAFGIGLEPFLSIFKKNIQQKTVEKTRDKVYIPSKCFQFSLCKTLERVNRQFYSIF